MPYQTRGMKVKDLIALLEIDGWQQVRQKGSHRQFHHLVKPGTVTVAGKPSVNVLWHTYQCVKTSGI